MMTSSAANQIPVQNVPPTTRFKKNVHPPSLRMLKRGKQNAKLGDIVTVKKWKNHVMYSLTLEERATCPTSCEQWNNCYGNNMPFAHRFDHTHPKFYEYLGEQMFELYNKHAAKGQGMVIRLHVLGDFYDKTMVDFWVHMLLNLPSLKIFGYTHHKSDTELGAYIDTHLNTVLRNQCAIRFSDDLSTQFRATVDSGVELICPEQLGKTKSCATCGYCWSSEKPVVFLGH